MDNNVVTVCVDFIKGKCSRETCKYFHPPEHLVNHLKKLKLQNNAAASAAAAVAAQHQLAAAANVIPLQNLLSLGNNPTLNYINLTNQLPIQQIKPYRRFGKPNIQYEKSMRKK